MFDKIPQHPLSVLCMVYQYILLKPFFSSRYPGEKDYLNRDKHMPEVEISLPLKYGPF
jgi:hypothetical protein